MATSSNNSEASLSAIQHLKNLSKVKNGTTVYNEAQILKSFAQNKLTEFNAKK